MTLDQYLSDTGTTETVFAERVKSTQPNINRLRRGKHVPGKELMKEIFAATGGRVTANDFYGIAA